MADLEALKLKRDQLNARIQQAEARQRATAKKADDRVKVLVGAAVLNQQTRTPEKLPALLSLLDSFLSRPPGVDHVRTPRFGRMRQRPANRSCVRQTVFNIFLSQPHESVDLYHGVRISTDRHEKSWISNRGQHRSCVSKIDSENKRHC